MNFTTRCALALVLAASSVSVFGCSSTAAEDDGDESGDAVMVGAAQLNEWTLHARRARQKSTELERTAMTFLAIRDLGTTLPVFQAASAISSDLDPLLAALEKNLAAATPKQAGFVDIPDVEYKAVLGLVQALRRSLTTELTSATENLSRAPKGAGLNEAQQKALVSAVSAYSDLILGVATRLGTVASAIDSWLDKAGGTPSVPVPKSGTELKRLTVGIIGDCVPSPSDAEKNWNAKCLAMRELLASSFPTIDDFGCGTPKNVSQNSFLACVKSDDGYATFKIATGGTVKQQTLRSAFLGIQNDASKSWQTACAEGMRSLQKQTLPGWKVVAASCGPATDKSTITGLSQYESILTSIVVRDK